MLASLLAPGTKIRFLGDHVHTVESVEQAPDAEMRSYGGCDVPAMSRAHQLKVKTTTPGVSLFINKDEDVEVVA